MQSAGKSVGCRALLSSSLLPRRKDFWELRHKVSDGLQFLREQQKSSRISWVTPALLPSFPGCGALWSWRSIFSLAPKGWTWIPAARKCSVALQQVTSESCRKDQSHLVCVMLIMWHHEKADGLHGRGWARKRALAPIHSKFIHKRFLRLWGSQSFGQQGGPKGCSGRPLVWQVSHTNVCSWPWNCFCLHVLLLLTLQLTWEGNKQSSLSYFYSPTPTSEITKMPRKHKIC